VRTDDLFTYDGASDVVIPGKPNQTAY